MTTVPTTVQERIPLPALPGSAEGGGGGGGGLTPKEILGIMRRRMVFITAMFVAFSGMAVGMFVIWYKYFPTYRAEAYIELISNQPRTDLDLTVRQLTKDEHERFVQTQAVLVKSDMVFLEAFKRQALKDTTWFKQFATPIEAQKSLERELGSSAVRGTNLLRVNMGTRKADDAPTIVNSIIDTWEIEVKRLYKEQYEVELRARKTEINDLEKAIQTRETRMRAIREQMAPGVLETGGGGLPMETLKDYRMIVSTKELELAELRGYRDSYAGSAVSAEDQSLVELDPQVGALNAQVFQIDQQIAVNQQKLGKNHSAVKLLTSSREGIQKQLDDLRSQKYAELRMQRLEQFSTAVASTQQALLSAQNSMAIAEAELMDQVTKYRQFEIEKESLDREVATLAELQNAARLLERVKSEQSGIDFKIRQRATVPLERSSPPKLLVPVGIVLSFILAIACAIGLELMDTRLRTVQDITRHVEVAVLGAVPHSDDEEIDIQRPETAVIDLPRTMFAEAFRRIRTSLQFSAPASRQRTVMICSPQPEEGSTTVACNLAATLAGAGRRVLLVDANFRRPRVHRVYDSPSWQGLSNILVGTGQLSEFISTTRLPNLDILPAGPTPPNPAELLSSDAFRSFLEDAVNRYDQVLIDSPPVLLASDAAVISTTVDGVILVLRAREHSRGAARRAVTMLQAVNAHLFGAVLNAAQVTRGGYFREQLRSYYDYQLEADGDGASPSLPSGGPERNLPPEGPTSA